MSSMIIRVKVQLKGDDAPKNHLALVVPGAMTPEDLIPYRNAITSSVKALLTDEGLSGYLAEDLFWLVQLSEFITTSLDNIKRKPL